MNTARSCHDPLRQELLPAEELDEEVVPNEVNPCSSAVQDPSSPGTPPSLDLRRPSWGIMGSILGRLTRSGSCSTASSSGGDAPCTLVSVERLPANYCPEYSAPIVGYEVMEERARFTIFKVRVQHQSSGRHWFVFRRYTDFSRLNRKLRGEYPGLRFALPPKRWFGDNFDPIFLEDRVLGLQAFVNNILAHMDINKCKTVRDFFCLDDPPSPEDSLEESRMLCESLEDAVIRLQEVVRQRDREADLLRAEVNLLKTQQQALLKSLKLQSRLSSVAYAQLQDEQRLKMDSSQSQLFLAEMRKVNQFNMALAKTIDRSLKTPSLDGSKLSLTRVEEETRPTSSSLEATNSSDLEKVASMDDICSRSTGDGSTGSLERLPPVGGITEAPPHSEIPLSTTISSNTNCNLQSNDDLKNTLNCEDKSFLACNISDKSCLKGSIIPAAQIQLDSISFKKLLENNPELTESRLSKNMRIQTVVPLSSIPIVST